MALLTSELTRIKAELGYPVLSSFAEPYIGIAAIFEVVVQPYLLAGATTTSSTAVDAETSATPVTLTLDSATGFSTGERVVIDIDDRQEIVTAQSLSGASLTVLLTKAHSGTYPVTVEGGESIVREILTRIREVKSRMAAEYGTGSLKKVDEIEFYQAVGQTSFGVLGENLNYWREELSAVLGVPSMWNKKAMGSRTLSVY